MRHVAIDLGGRESQICVRDEQGRILGENRVQTAALPFLFGEEKEKSRVVVETCAEGFAVADAAARHGHEVRVVPATLVRSLGVGARGKKNDRQDARVLSEVSTRIDLPSVHIPSARSRNWKSMCGARQGLVESRTKLVNVVRANLRGQIKTVRSGSVETFTTRVRKKLSLDEVPAFLERLLKSIDALSEQIEEADRELTELVKKEPLLERLMTAPGIGPVTAVLFAATLDDVKRFDDAHQVESYLGLVPGEDSSGDRKRITSITKAGSTKLRWLLVQAAWAARRRRGTHPAVLWSLEVERRRGRKIAAVALARKLAGILYGMWRDAKDYDPRHETRASAVAR